VDLRELAVGEAPGHVPTVPGGLHWSPKYARFFPFLQLGPRGWHESGRMIEAQ
jgi:hypothetical protein